MLGVVEMYKNSSLINQKNKDGSTPLHLTCCAVIPDPSIEEIFNILMNNPLVDFNVQDSHGFTPIMYCAIRDNIRFIHELKARHAKISTVNEQGNKK